MAKKCLYYDGIQMNLSSDLFQRVFIGSAPVLAATNANNGQVYVLSKMLDDETVKPKARSILEELDKMPQLSTFKALLENTRLPEILKGKQTELRFKHQFSDSTSCFVNCMPFMISAVADEVHGWWSMMRMMGS